MNVFLAILVAFAIGGALVLWAWVRRRARKRLLHSPLDDHARAIIAREVPLTRKLPPALRERLEGKINLFLEQVEFLGCNGLEVTEDMRLSIAAQACLLVVNTETWYANLRTILIYPGAFKSRRAQHHGYVVTEREIVRVGESWPRGPVILSWAAAEGGASDAADGHNVVFHEFAHQIDDLSGQTDGVPALARDQSFAGWERAFVSAFQRHVAAVEAGRPTLLDPYAAEGPEEFFAVSVEVFFERPADLRAHEPAVYAQLSKLFRVDPVSWK